jgi:hypothetical protein
VPFWSDEEEENCVKMVNAICEKRRPIRRDPMYDFRDFVMFAEDKRFLTNFARIIEQFRAF